jgi:excinuclease ABC subunit C
VRSATNDDFAAMYEVLTRRFRRTLARQPRDAVDDDPSWAVPDLLVIDGGKGQLGSALAALGDLGVELVGERSVDVIGLAKERDLAGGNAPDRVYVKGQKDAVQLRPNSPELYVLARIRDEAHRFANTFHRDRRTRQALRSELDDVPGIGETRRKNLLRHFGSVRALREASVDAIAKAPGMNRKAAEAVKTFLATRADAADDAAAEDGTAADASAADGKDAGVDAV